MKTMKTMKTIRPWVWPILCVASFGLGYGIRSAIQNSRAEDDFARTLTWAVAKGMVTINYDKVYERFGDRLLPSTNAIAAKE